MTPKPEPQLEFVDVAGVGINATDTIIRLPHFPVLDSKVEVISSEIKLGGQVASAMIACQRWGLSTRYVGKIGDDEAGKLQIADMKREGVDAHWIVAKGCTSQSSYILVDESCGERTVLWKRDSRIALEPKDLERGWITPTSVLLVDGHDTAASAQAARWACEKGIPVVGDFDNCYPGVEALLKNVDYVVTSQGFPKRLTGDSGLLQSLPQIFAQFKCHLIAATLGAHGVLAWDGLQFLLCPGYQVAAVDTTGAGDIFHGAFIYGLVRGFAIKGILEFSCAAAALSCTEPGARGGIKSVREIRKFQRHGRRSARMFTREQLFEASRLARLRFSAEK